MAAPVNDPLAQLHAPPVFIVGQARSGTTWVHDIYRAHPNVRGVFESMIFERGNGLAGLLSDAHWGGSRSRGLGEIATREDVVDAVRSTASRLLAHGLAPHHHYLVEKTPGHAQMIPTILEVFPGARFVHVLRDGRDVWVSARAARRSWARSWTSLPAGLEVARAAHRWQETVSTVRRQHEAAGDALLEVRYEALRSDPFAGYAQLFDFVGIPYDDNLLDQIHQETDFERSGRASDPTGFYRAARVGDWQRSFHLVEGLLFNLFGGRALVECGYERSRAWRAPLVRRRADRSVAKA